MSAFVWDQIPLSGRSLIEASAGTGKTHAITTLVLRLLLERDRRLSEILVVTFTRAAAAELRQRIGRRLRTAARAFGSGDAGADVEIAALLARTADRARARARALGALRELDEAPILTLHGFCARVLAEHAFELGAPLAAEAVADDAGLAAAVVADFWGRELAAASVAEARALGRRAPFPVLLWLARQAVARPDLELVPALAEPIDTAGPLSALMAARARAREVWREERGTVARLLTGHPGLKRNLYRADWIPGGLAAIDALRGAPIPAAAELVGAARRLTPGALTAATRAGQEPPRHACFDLLEALVCAHDRASEALEAWVLAFEQRLVAHARATLPGARRRAGVVTFDDLLLQLLVALRGPGGEGLASALRSRYPAALVDEFQDTDPVQYEILDRIYADPAATLLVIGDPKQAIYSFRGADLFAYLRAARDVGREALTLDVCYRADPRLVAAVNRLFARRPAPFLLEDVRYRPVAPRPDATERLATPGGDHGAMELVVLGAAEAGSAARAAGGAASDVPAAAAAEVVRWLGAGATIDGAPLGAGDVAVLTRTNEEAERVQRELARRGVPSVLYGDRSVLDTEEAFEVSLVLGALAAPARGERVRAALATRLVGVDGGELWRLASDEAAWEGWVERFERWHERWRSRGFGHAFRALLDELDVVPRLLGEPRGERRVTDVLHLGELLNEAAITRHLGPVALERWFARVRHDRGARDEVIIDATQLRLESDAEAVRVVTVHRSKGLEYPIVVVASLAASRGDHVGGARPVLFHDPEAARRPRLCLGGPGQQRAAALAATEALAEGLRLAYVAVTRARHQATVLVRPSPDFDETPLGSLLRGPAATAAARPGRGGASAAAVLEELRAFAGDDPATLRARPVAPASGVAAPAPAPAPVEVTLRRATRRFAFARRVTSYTALVARAPVLAEDEGTDHGDIAAGDAVVVEAIAAPSAAPTLVPLHAFPRGAAAGIALHAVLEHVDFPSYDPAAARPGVEVELARQGLDRAAWGELVAAALGGVIDTPLADGGPRLRDLRPGAWRTEVEFTLPVCAPASAAPRARALDAAALARVIGAHGGPAISPGYPERVAALGFAALVGHLRGFVDLVFEHDGRYFLVDYKSNHLGEDFADYSAPALAAAMAEHHYFLQAFLYAVALHRHLAACRRGYDYDRDFGGVYYLFLRGMAPGRPGAGVFAARPPRALVEGLSRVLEGDATGVEP